MSSTANDNVIVSTRHRGLGSRAHANLRPYSAPLPVKRCRRGHDLSKAQNVYLYKGYVQCRICRKLGNRRHEAKQRKFRQLEPTVVVVEKDVVKENVRQYRVPRDFWLRQMHLLSLIPASKALKITVPSHTGVKVALSSLRFAAKTKRLKVVITETHDAIYVEKIQK